MDSPEKFVIIRLFLKTRFFEASAQWQTQLSLTYFIRFEKGFHDFCFLIFNRMKRLRKIRKAKWSCS
ncbi:MAG: hypothetical protein AUK29_09740 [Nitrospirae bacterium CG2_30_53_67]|nr:MAG: hypothetical protein AUK29_09740 [Nitrospirae bacterium CG2_30_53_67]